LVAVNAGVSPAPLAARPIAVFEFVQANVAPAGVLTKAEGGIEVPSQTEIFVIGFTTGVGSTVMV
jgi:hypothetical protein